MVQRQRPPERLNQTTADVKALRPGRSGLPDRAPGGTPLANGAALAARTPSLFDRLPGGVRAPVVRLLAARNGNRSVQRLLAPARPRPGSVQRAIGDGHDLTSPRFAGDPILKACFDDQARLAVGATGEAVGKVQQALIDLGFDLGPGAADSIYGPRTAAAVKQFKAQFRLGFETIGDVGPGTMRKLDDLLPGAPVKPDEEPRSDENTDESCPADDEIVTALQDQTAVGQTTTTSADVGAPAGGSGHVSMSDAVSRFKAGVNVSDPVGGPTAGTNITDRGQFFWGEVVRGQLDADLIGLSGPGAGDFVTKAKALVAIIRNDPDDKDGKKGVKTKFEELQAIAARTKDPTDKARMQALLADSRVSAGKIISDLWIALDARPDDTRPSVSQHVSVATFRRIRSFEKRGCFDHVGKVADRLRRKGGIKAVDPKLPAFADVVVGTRDFFTDRRPIKFPQGLDPASIDAAVDTTGASKFMMGEVFKQQGVAGVVGRMRRALDAGQLLHVRVISGVGVGSEIVPVNAKGKRTQGRLPDTGKDGKPKAITSFEEHSLLVIAFDNDLFVFNDPDATMSHASIGGFTEPGFGFLAFDSANDRLGTGFGVSGMPVDEEGLTRKGEKRYQAIEVKTV